MRDLANALQAAAVVAAAVAGAMESDPLLVVTTGEVSDPLMVAATGKVSDP